MNSAGGNKLNVIKAPMPGLIVDLKIQVGDNVKQGDAVLILEAMKMENILKSPGEGVVKNLIKSPGEGVVKNLNVKKGDSVEKGQVLIEF